MLVSEKCVTIALTGYGGADSWLHPHLGAVPRDFPDVRDDDDDDEEEEENYNDDADGDDSEDEEGLHQGGLTQRVFPGEKKCLDLCQTKSAFSAISATEPSSTGWMTGP